MIGSFYYGREKESGAEAKAHVPQSYKKRQKEKKKRDNKAGKIKEEKIINWDL